MASQAAEYVRMKLREADLWNRPLIEVRQVLEALPAAEIPEGVSVTVVDGEGFKGEWHIPEGASEDKTLIHFHGGGYCLGIYPTNRNFVASIAKELGVSVFLLDYSLAPENPFPKAIEEALAAYRFLLKQGYASRNIAFMGDSSGCGLALVAMSILRDNGEPLPGGMALMTPMVDCTHSGESVVTRAESDPYRPSPEFRIIDNYTRGLDAGAPMISPLFGDPMGFPPMLVHSADLDIFLSDGVRLHERAMQAGIESSLKVWDGMWHNFHMSAEFVPEAREAMDDLLGFLRGIPSL